jgi:ubiquitin-protein ligase
MAIPKIYEPRQPESLHSLLKTLANTSKIFLSCLTGSASEKVSEEIAKKITTTFEMVDEAVSEYETMHNDEEEDRKIL